MSAFKSSQLTPFYILREREKERNSVNIKTLPKNNKILTHFSSHHSQLGCAHVQEWLVLWTHQAIVHLQQQLQTQQDEVGRLHLLVPAVTRELCFLVRTGSGQAVSRSVQGEMVHGLLCKLVHAVLELPLEVVGVEPAVEDVREGHKHSLDGVADLSVVTTRRAAEKL